MCETRNGQPARQRRRFITAGAGTLVLALTHHEIAFGATLLAVRVWPAEEYTRVTLEHDGPLTFSHFMLREPSLPLRLVVDIEGLELTPTLKELVGKNEANDPYIALVRVGQNRPRVARLVIELKEDIKPQVFALEPIGPYKHRLVLDLYPINPPDPLLALLREQARPRDADSKPSIARRPQPDVQRIITVMLDPGHGGEDPGAIGRRGTYEKTVTLEI
ncbi:MAG: N-acetylmuramoyl-L-alanine amidase, partial [Burkholderiaceae bacterium]